MYANCLVINQNAPVGTFLTSVNCTLNSPTFSIDAITPEVNGTILSLNESGGLSLAVPAEFIPVNEYNIVLSCASGSLTNNTVFTWNRVEENEFSPELTHNFTTYYYIPESVGHHFVVADINATDHDLGIYGTLLYEIVGGNFGNAFSINSSTGMISVSTTLNYSIRHIYELQIQISNPVDPGASILQFINANVTIFLQAVPHFNASLYSASVAETGLSIAGLRYQRPQLGFITVLCTDLDSLASEISYNLSISDTFNINSTTGQLLVTNDLDYDTQSSQFYEFEVFCTDGITIDSALVQITVEPINEHRPELTVQPSNLFVSSNESYFKAGRVIISNVMNDNNSFGTIIATDQDLGPDGQITFVLESQNVNSLNQPLLVVNASSGVVSVANDIDADDEPAVFFGVFRIGAYDQSSAYGHSGQIYLFITKSADELPTFSQQSYEVTIAENSPVNTILLTASCTDDDTGGVGGFSHISFVNETDFLSTYFNLNNETGRLYLKITLDYESYEHIEFSLVCYDTVGESDTSRVRIDIIPLNDEVPYFSTDIYTFVVSRTTPHNLYYIGLVMAYDNDVQYGSNLTYSLANPYFHITSTTGEIYLMQSLESVDEDLLEYNVTVSDDDALHTVSVPIIFNITQGNYMSPQFTTQYPVITVSELLPVGSQITVLFCNDTESGDNGRVSYEILTGNVASAFNIHATDGTIFVANPLILPQNTTLASYILEVRCFDHGVPSLSDTTIVRIQVRIAENLNPDISNDTIVSFVSEDATLSYPVVTITAIYYDSSNLFFSLLNESVPMAFIIVSMEAEGDVIVNSQLDRESRDSYFMTVVAEAPGNKNDTAELYIYVRDVNDNHPQCSTLAKTLQISENNGIGHEIFDLNCTDADTGQNANLTYVIDNNYGVIGVDSTGSVFLINHLNMSNSSTLSLLITVSDQGFVPNAVMVTLVVNILTMNNFAPVFTNLPAVLNVSEATPIFAFPLFAVQATDNDKGQFGIIRYTLNNESHLPFLIVPNTGELYLEEKLDFHIQQYYYLNITATDSAFTVHSTIIINVVDANEHSPTCSSTLFTRQIIENIPPSSVEPLSLGCTDNDKGPYGTLAYDIIAGNTNNDFSVSPNGDVVPNNELDYERTQSYNLNLLISDLGSPPRTESIDIQITVSPVNEYTPQIHNGPYSESVFENTPIGYTIIHVNASDEDAGNDGILEYRLSPAQTLFGITNEGYLLVTGILDREASSNYSFTVIVNDLSTASQSASSSIFITILDIDDSPPTFEMPLYINTVSANMAQIGYVVAITRCTDLDEGNNAAINYSIIPSESASFFSISEFGVIQINNSLPLSSIYSFKVMCSGVLNSNFTDMAFVSLTIQIESNITFDNATYTYTLLESIKPVYTFLTINATSITGSSITYSLVDPSSVFQIQGSTGQLSLVGVLDFESNQSYILVVEATDSGMPPNVAQVAVNIYIQNVNDGSPMFTDTTTNIVLNEEQQYTLPVGTYACSDSDIGTFGDITYHIASGNVNSKFAIDEMSGSLQLNSAIDYESTTSFSLVIECADGGNPSRNNSVIVFITINPVNEYAPQFSSQIISLTVDELLSVPSPITINNELKATDNDDFPHNQIWYSIISGNDNQVFSISSSTSILTLIKNLDYETTSSYQLMVQVDDGGGLSNPGYSVLNSTATVNILVSDANDHSPSFSKSIYVGSVSESALPGDYISSLTLNCTDEDSGSNGQTILTIEDGNTGNAFVVLSNGRISVNNTLDFESLSSFYLTVRCSDQGSTPRLDETTVIITITDESEFGPQFQQHSYEFYVNETLIPGSIVGKVTAIDQDTGSAGDVKYAISNTTDIPFNVDVNTGNIFLTTPLDYEAGPTTYNLQVLAYDFVNQSDMAIVIFTIINVDEDVPYFTASNYYGVIRESLPPGASVNFVNPILCTDSDDAADEISPTFALTTSSNGPLESDFPLNIHQTTGVITALISLDLETTVRYSFNAICSDSAGNTATAGVTVDVNAFNDFAPVFNGTPYSQTIQEGISLNSEVFSVSATDADLQYNTITYSIVQGNDDGIFSIDPISGVIRNIQDIDHEQQSLHMLNISAKNVIPVGDVSGSPSLASYTNLTINVTDINDNSPVISPPSATAVIRAEDGPGTTVLSVSCEDDDSGLFGMTQISLSGPIADKFSLLDNGTIITLENITTNLLLIVNCSDFGSPPRSTTAEITISTSSSNDFAPVFPEDVKRFDVYENFTVGESIGCYTAVDADGSHTADGIITYTLTHVIGPNHFYVVESTGCIVLAAGLDYDDAILYTYKLRAQDGGIPQRFSDATIIISILNVDIDPPEFTESSYSREISEGVSPGALVSQSVYCTDRDDDDVITYSIVGGNDAGIFVINETTGLIRLATSLDYESNVLHSLKIRCNDSTNLFDEVNMTITVLPVNEHTPFIQSKLVYYNEQSSIGTPITVIDYIDLDDGIDGEVTFEIIDPVMSNLFVIAGHNLLFNAILDREAEHGARYDIEMEVTDLALLSRSSIGYVNVSLIDINDNAPMPLQSVYTAMYINETATIGTYILTVNCTDPDIGVNGEVEYTIENNQLFAIDANGVISVKSDLRYRQNDVIALEVYCSDLGTPTLSSSTIIQIPIFSVNYYAPVFINTPLTVSLLENFTTLTPFANVTALDNDTGLNGQITYSLLDDFENQFYIDQSTGEIMILLPLDYETASFYNLTVIAIDGSNDSIHMNRKTDMLTIIIEVEGINEYSPICSKATYTGYIDGNIRGTVLSINCTDKDHGTDGLLSYYISPNSYSSYFNITSNGELSILSLIAPDSSITIYELTVIVTDMGTPSKQVNIQVNLIYSFVNMYSPMFNQSAYSFSVSELTLVGDVVFTFNAIDPDPGIQGEVSYSVQNTEYFRIHSETGDLYLSRPLDWETLRTINFLVVAQDNDPYNSSSSNAAVNVTISDQNDNFPRCSQSFYTTFIDSNLNLGDSVFNVSNFCGDIDGPEYSQLSYEIHPSVVFIIDSVGVIHVNSSLEAGNAYILSVSVSDNGSPPLSTNLTLTVQVQFINEIPPTFLALEYTFNVSENSSLLTIVGNVQASDADSSSTDLTFSIVTTGVDSFYIEPLSGDILLLNGLNYEGTNIYQFTVMVNDAGSYDGSNVLSSTAEVTLFVININDNAPILTNSGLYGATVNKTTPIGTSVINIQCSDNDLPPYGNPMLIFFDLSSVPFNVSSNGGIGNLYISHDLTTFNGSLNFVINFTCIDQGDKSATGKVHIFVPDTAAPQFSSSSYEWILAEDSDTGTTFSDLYAISQDNSEITYSLQQSDSTFYINPNTGVISLAQTLDYETQISHGLIVTAQDGSNKVSNVFVLVTVVDVNDNTPLVSPSALMTVEQYRDPGYPIGTVRCTDEDSNSSMLMIEFNSSISAFRIDSNGIVYVNETLDSTPVYVIPVVCYVANQPDVYTTGVLTIQVTFINLYIPQFDYNLYQASISEDTPILSEVTTVHATDDDIGSFGILSYSIILDNSEKFYINSQTGTIYLLSSLDREADDIFTLTVQVVDGGTGQTNLTALNSATTTVTINVLDVNDNRPALDKPSYLKFIFTNHTVLSPVLTVSCSDPDLAENGTVTYSIQPSQSSFIIDSNGTLLLASDQSVQTVFNFNVVCSDIGAVSLYSSSLVTIVVQKIDFDSPVFQQQEYFVTIPENQILLAPFLTVFANSSDDDSTIVYSIIAGNEDNHFIVNSMNGEVSAIQELNYIMKNFYTITIQASTNSFISYSSYTVVNITVTDVNNNNPSFIPLPFYTGNISELASIPTPVVQVNCSDSDPTSSITYSITSAVPSVGVNHFNLTTEGVVFTQQNLDYETISFYSLTIQCSDGGPEPAEAIVQINIEPVNEYKPVFLQSKYTFTTLENEELSTIIGNVTAVDYDAGIHGEISYSLQNPGHLSPIFVDPTSGELLISNIIDYETIMYYNLSVIARDYGGSESYVPVEITVTNLQDVPPVLIPAVSVYNGRVLTNSPLGLFIQSYTCTDGDGGNTNISITNGNNLGYFSLNSFNQIVWNSPSISFTADVVISLTLECIDVSNATDTASLSVVVGLPDSIPPLFNTSTYMTSVMENAPIGSTVLTVSAISKPNNTIEYSLFNLPANFPFDIDSSTGEITVNGTLDYEKVQLYSFPVQAKDTNQTSIGLATVEINIIDINDNPPILLPSLISLVLEENSLTGVPYASFTCTDIDSSNNGAIHYSVESSNLISVDPISGYVTLQSSLNYESNKTHNITVVCIDGGSPPLSDSATVFIQVLGINEYSPQFSKEIYNYTVSEKTALSTIIGSVEATDIDHGSNGEFIYMMYGGSGSSYFSVNMTSGDIFVTNFLNASEESNLISIIAAVDYGPVTPLISTTSVEVAILDVNEKPYFDALSYLALTNVSSINMGDILTTVNCYDYDTGNNGKVILQILQNPANVSLMVNTSGDGSISSPLLVNNLLTAGSYEVIVECRDFGYPQLSRNVSVLIIVKPANTPPMFSKAVYGLSVNEDTGTGTVLLIINATDAESGVTYGIVGGTGLGTFGIGVNSGEVTLISNLDYETVQSYLLTVSAVDNDFLNPLQATAQISIVVVNVNDHPPLLTPSTFTTARQEGDYVNEPLQLFTCTDADGSSTNLMASPSPLFTIDNTGQLLISGTVDYESAMVLTATIVCTDASVAGVDGIKSATATLSVSVSPVNFYAPVIVSPSIFNVSEGAEIMHIVANISSYDPDMRGTITYSTESHNSIFSLNANNGQLVLLQTLDRESIDMYELNIVVSDNDNAPGVSPKVTTELVTLLITDINDRSPSCDTTLQIITIYAGTYNETLSLFNASCNDQDIGINAELTYLLNQNNLPNAAHFYLDNTTGELYFNGTITKASSGSFIGITVSDMGTNPLSTPAQIQLILMIFTGDEPRFEPNYFNITISESHPAAITAPVFNGSILLNALQNADNADIQFSFITNTTKFIIDPGTGNIVLLSSAMLDYDEGQQTFSLGIQATVNLQTTEAILDIYLSDYNDNAPVFTQQLYTATVMENLNPGQPVITLSATDIDSGSNAIVRYSMLMTDSNFQIDQTSGLITTLKQFDREIISSYTITIQATDQGNPAMSSTAIVEIQIGDENDNAPYFDNDNYNFVINDLSVAGQVIHTFMALDPDTNAGSIKYALVFTNHVSFLTNLLTLNPNTGKLSLKNNVPLDHLIQYELDVSVNDQIHTATTHVVITIATLSYTVISMKENVENQTFNVFTFLQLSSNLSNNAVYFIDDGDIYGQFDVNDNGILTNIDLLDRENISFYSLEISAIDNTTNENSILRLDINVADENDNPPIFNSSNYTFNISEGHLSVQTLLGAVHATDADKENTQNSRVTYSLIEKPPQSVFDVTLNQITGELEVSGILDREYSNKYLLRILAEDHGEPVAMYAFTEVYVYLSDINDNAPRFSIPTVTSFIVYFVAYAPQGSYPQYIEAINPFSTPTETDAFYFFDPDSSDFVSISLSGSTNISLLSNSSPAYLISTGDITLALNNTEFEVVLSDGYKPHEVTKTVLLMVLELQPMTTTSLSFEVTTTMVEVSPSVSTTPTNFIDSPLGIAIIIVGFVMFFAFVLFIFCVLCFCYQYYQRKKDHAQRSVSFD